MSAPINPIKRNRPLGKTDGNGNLDPTSFLDPTFRGDYTGTNLIYKGFARPGSDEGALVWQIAKLEYDGSNNILSVKYPTNSSGAVSSDYEFSWTLRASYTYA